MSTIQIKFTRDTDRTREGGRGYKKGDVVSVSPASANHWYARGAAEAHKPTQAVKEMEQQIAEAQTGPVDDPDIDGGRTGVGAEPVAGAGGSRPTLRAPGNRGK